MKIMNILLIILFNIFTPSSYQTLKGYLTGIIPSKLSKIHILFFESNLVLPLQVIND
jgi:hypothetical protein